MNPYEEMLKAIIRREFALLGRNQTREILKSIGIELDEKGNIVNSDGIDGKKVDEVLEAFKKHVGFVGLLVVKLPVRRIAIQNNVPVPSSIM